MAGTGLPIQTGTRRVTTQQSPTIRSPSASTPFQGLAESLDQLDQQFQAQAEASRAAYVARAQVDIRRQAIELRDQYAADPDGFDQAWAAYSQATIEKADPGVAGALEVALGKEGNRVFGEVTGEARTRDRENRIESLTSAGDLAADEMSNLAMQGQIGTPEFQDAMERYQASNQLLVDAGDINEDEADLRAVGVFSRVKLDAQLPTVLGTLQNSGERAAFDLIEDMAQDPQLRMTNDERGAFERMAKQAVRERVSMVDAALARQDRAERMADRRRARHQEQVFVQRYLDQAAGNLDEAQVFADVQTGDMKPQDAEKLLGFMDQEETEEQELNAAYLEVLARRGQMNINQVHAFLRDGQINPDGASRLLPVVQSSSQGETILESRLYKDTLDDLTTLVAGTASPFAILDDDTKTRLVAAERELRMEVLRASEETAGQITRGRMDEIFVGIQNKYRAGTREEWMVEGSENRIDVGGTRARLAEEYQAGTIKRSEFIRRNQALDREETLQRVLRR